MLADNPYDVVPYNTCPRSQTHPDRMAAVAKLFGLDCAPLESCRVLEIGCGDGSNLIPLAYSFPQARIAGIDAAKLPIAEGRRRADALELANLSLEAMDLREMRTGSDEFDYIIAHGVYSWTSPAVRDALVGICAGCLASDGVALISYNAQPGHHTLLMLRDMMQFHVRGTQNPYEKIENARKFLHLVRDRTHATDSWSEVLRTEIAALDQRDDA